VGGIKEKVLGARRAGVLEVILPRRNEKDLAEVPAEVKKDLRFHFVSDMSEILDLALEPAAAPVEPPAAHLPAPATPPLPATGPPAAS
jgi:ATP-dependent Lon protease